MELRIEIEFFVRMEITPVVGIVVAHNSCPSVCQSLALSTVK